MKIIQECASLTEWQEIEVPSATRPDFHYVVTLPPWNRDEDEAVCECESYEYRGRCRHQREALQQICSWSQLDGPTQTPEQRKEHICPDCGGPTNLVALGEE